MATATRGRSKAPRALPANLSAERRHALDQFLTGQISAGALSCKLAESGNDGVPGPAQGPPRGAQTQEFVAIPRPRQPARSRMLVPAALAAVAALCVATVAAASASSAGGARHGKPRLAADVRVQHPRHRAVHHSAKSGHRTRTAGATVTTTSSAASIPAQASAPVPISPGWAKHPGHHGDAAGRGDGKVPNGKPDGPHGKPGGPHGKNGP